MSRSQLSCNGSGGNVCAEDTVSSSNRKKVVNDEYCFVCEDGGELVCCDYCSKSFHLTCHAPELNAIPTGDFKCCECSSNINIDDVVFAYHFRWDYTNNTPIFSCDRGVIESYTYKKSPFGMSRYYTIVIDNERKEIQDMFVVPEKEYDEKTSKSRLSIGTKVYAPWWGWNMKVKKRKIPRGWYLGKIKSHKTGKLGDFYCVDFEDGGETKNVERSLLFPKKSDCISPSTALGGKGGGIDAQSGKKRKSSGNPEGESGGIVKMDEEDYQYLRKRYLTPQTHTQPGVAGDMSLRTRNRGNAVDQSSPAFKKLKARVDTLTERNEHAEVFRLLCLLREWETEHSKVNTGNSSSVLHGGIESVDKFIAGVLLADEQFQGGNQKKCRRKKGAVKTEAALTTQQSESKASSLTSKPVTKEEGDTPNTASEPAWKGSSKDATSSHVTIKQEEPSDEGCPGADVPEQFHQNSIFQMNCRHCSECNIEKHALACGHVICVKCKAQHTNQCPICQNIFEYSITIRE